MHATCTKSHNLVNSTLHIMKNSICNQNIPQYRYGTFQPVYIHNTVHGKFIVLTNLLLKAKSFYSVICTTFHKPIGKYSGN